jgi:hypothetical protein
MDWSLLNITHAIAHQVFPRDRATRQPIEPKFSERAFNLVPSITEVLRARVTAAISQSAHGFEMGIHASSTESFCHLGGEIACGNAAQFVLLSKALARTLNIAQSGRDLQGGAVVVMRATVGAATRPCCIVIKAELQDGLTMKYDNGAFSVELLEELLLTQAQRLYKIGVLVQTEQIAKRADGTHDPQGFKAFVFDYQMSSKETREAAHYFATLFLGLTQLPSAKKRTQNYYEVTREFIKNSAMSDEEKLASQDALRVELRSNAATINPDLFADNHMPNDEVRDAYSRFLVEKGVGRDTIDKDIEYIKGKLRRPKMMFSSGVSITAPGERVAEYVTVLPREVGQDDNTTRVQILGRLDGQI